MKPTINDSLLNLNSSIFNSDPPMVVRTTNGYKDGCKDPPMVVRTINGCITMVVRPTNGCKDGQCEEAGLDIIPVDGKVLDIHI